MGLTIDLEKCTGCGLCISVCPFGCLSMQDNRPRVNESCTLCGACRDACPCGAICLESFARDEPAGEGRGVWVFTEQRQGEIKSVSFELLAKGRELAATLNTELCAVCFGYQVKGTEDLIACGADKVYLLDSPEMADNNEDLLTGRMVSLIKEYKPEIVLAGATALGRSFIPRVAAAVDCGLTADCTGLEIDMQSRELLQTRPAFGGNIMATIICPSARPQMSTVRPRVFKKGSPDKGRKGEIVRLDFSRDALAARTKLTGFIEDISERIKLDEADIIVAGGRGLGKAENFKILKDLAGVMGAALGSSRPPVDDGWISYAHQVGQTGKTVCPRLYIACGISGSVQHMAGMQTSDTIVAINCDPSAPIFEIATYGIVGDLFKIIPLMIETLSSQ
ncbi:MAG: electron transfer flavoprotein subunit alpha [Dehalococcoidales bacterium]|nr:electron transfer flavoprotein subunit alpha [Dehalococcoidales bacterium]